MQLQGFKIELLMVKTSRNVIIFKMRFQRFLKYPALIHLILILLNELN